MNLFLLLLEKIKQSQVLKFNYFSNEIEIDTPFVKEKYIEKFRQEFPTVDKDEVSITKYGWESYLRDVVLPKAQEGDLRLVYRSERVRTNHFERTLEKRRSRSNYAKKRYQIIDRIDLATMICFLLLRAMQTS